MSNNHLTTTRFADFQLPEKLMRSLNEAGIEFCTPIQEKTLPLTLTNKDVSGQAQTGTGKTFSFLLAMFAQLEKTKPLDHKTLRSIIIAPTRELAYQIYEDACLLNKHMDYKIGLAYGGKDYLKQKQIIESGVDILIGTPGRLIDYFKQKVYSLKKIEVMVLDEADRMFDLGFIKDIRFIFRRLPAAENRLSMLFSATFTYRVHELAYEHMNNPELVEIEGESVTVEQVNEGVYYPAMEEKLPLLISLVKKISTSRVLIFVNTKHTGEHLYQTLKANDFKVSLLSGDIEQRKREKLLKEFKAGNSNILVATDVAARGLHITDVTHVFNYDLPQDAEDYVHRIGRTAIAGAKGEAISFACEQYAISLPDIESYIKHKIPSLAINYEDFCKYNEISKKSISKRNVSKNARPRKKTHHNKEANVTKQKHNPHKSAHKSEEIKNSLSRPTNNNAKQNHNTHKTELKNNGSRRTNSNAIKQKTQEKPLQKKFSSQKFSRRGYEIPAIG